MSTDAPGRGPATPGRLLAWDVLWFVVLCVVCQLSVWGHGHYASTDGPSHAYNAAVIARLLTGECPIYGTYYTFNVFPVPNWTGHFFMALAATVAPAAVAEKVFLALYAVGLPLAARYAATAAGPSGATIALLVFPFVHGFAALAGWYNFACGLALYLLALGFWLRHGAAMTRGRWVVLFALLALLYLSHPMALGVTVLALCVQAAWRTFAASEAASPWALRLRAAVRAGVAPLACAAPLLVLAAAFLLWNDPLEGRALHDHSGFGNAVRVLGMLAFNEAAGPLAPRDAALTTAYGLFLWVTFGTTLFGRGRARATATQAPHGLLIVLALLVAIGLVVPQRAAGGGNLGLRFAMFAWLSLLPWLATRSYGPRHTRLMRFAALAVTLAQLLVRAPTREDVDDFYRGARGALAHVPPNNLVQTVVPGRAALPRPHYIPILLRNGAAHAAADRCLIDVGNYEGHVTSFPLRARPGVARGSDVVGGDAASVAGAPVSWLLVSVPAQPSDEERTAAQGVTEALAPGWELVAHDGRGGDHRLYRRRATAWPLVP
jgi:hypothetical protein